METWKPVVGYEGTYEVSDKGGIRRCDGKRVYVWQKDGRQYAMLAKPEGGRFGTTIARLVYVAFNGPVPKKFLVTYRDGNPRNVSVENLRLRWPGNHKKLTRETAKSILCEWRRDRSWGAMTRIANERGVSVSLVSQIVHGQRWHRVRRRPRRALVQRVKA